MVYCRPASTFCCGCTVYAGVQATLFIHLSVRLHQKKARLHRQMQPGPQPAISRPRSSWPGSLSRACRSSSSQCGASGTRGRSSCGSTLARAPLWDMSFEVEEFLLEGMNCNTMPSVLMQIGKSWACGALRITDCVVVLGSLALQAYLLYNVWSHCEESAGGGLLGDLMVGEAALARKKKMEDPYEAFLDHTGDVPEGYGAVPATKGGSQQIFGGKLHEMRFPPPPPSARAWGR
ncbi:unnamed protein product [Prorocentrum cordatum]|uniref:Uncharacterized protein n=1 Tax=Prorocentrum cordatum TaxID=2364126 RepID=A0ABN9V788_9DINO|nr:unnamed protein product [Polarella glacialis]